MEYFDPLFLTTLVGWFIIYIVVKTKTTFANRSKKFDLKHRQSTIHSVVEPVLPTNEEIISSIVKKKKESSKTKQSKQTYSPEQIKVIVVDNKAYWIQNNTFYETIVTEDGEIDQSLSKPVDTTNLGEEEVNTLMHIVDELRSVEKDDGGSSGN